MAIEALEGLTDQDLFDEANRDDEAPAEEVVAEPAEPEGQAEQLRDDAGRFAAQAETTATEPPARAPVDDNAAMVPSWRVREINDEKRTLADRLAALEADKANWQRTQAAPAASQPPAKAEAPDPLLDPAGYRDFIRNELREERLNERREDSLAAAHKTYKGEFEEAYAAAQKLIDPALKARMQQSRDPGETLIQWHREQKTRAEVGDDLNAFRQREQERLLSDPAFLAKAIEKARGQAQQPAARQGAPAVSLPPSLTRATNASAATSADDDDISDDGLWRHANA